VFIEHPSENLMASFIFTNTVLDEGTTFIFSSWICIANSSGGFDGHLADSRKPEASAASRCSNLDELVLLNLTGEIERMSIFDATSTCAALEPVDPTQTDPRRHILYSLSGYAMPLRSTRRLHGLSPSLTWRRT
jgi:hypothetical protein